MLNWINKDGELSECKANCLISAFCMRWLSLNRELE